MQKRIQQRLITTLGVFVSVSGYTPDVIKGVNIGQRMELLLLDIGHLEAMLSGLVSPEELFNLAVDKASYEGGTYYPLEKLFDIPYATPSVRFDVGAATRGKVRAALPGVATERLIFDIPLQTVGMVCDQKGNLLVNLPEGVAEVDPRTRSARWVVPLPMCSGHVAIDGEGTIYFARNNGIGAWKDGRVVALAGGLSGAAILFLDPSGEPCAMDNGGFFQPDLTGMNSEGENAAVLTLGAALGDSRRISTSVRGTYLGDAISIDHGRIAAVGGGSVEVIDRKSGSAIRYTHNLTNTFSIERYDEAHVVIVANGQTLAFMSVDGATVLPIADLDFNGAIFGALPRCRRLLLRFFHVLRREFSNTWDDCEGPD